jgi:hypothetical protein
VKKVKKVKSARGLRKREGFPCAPVWTSRPASIPTDGVSVVGIVSSGSRELGGLFVLYPAFRGTHDFGKYREAAAQFLRLGAVRSQGREDDWEAGIMRRLSWRPVGPP